MLDPDGPGGRGRGWFCPPRGLVCIGEVWSVGNWESLSLPPPLSPGTVPSQEGECVQLGLGLGYVH